MLIKKELFIEKYLEEIKENIGKLEQTVLELKKDPQNEEDLNSLLRVLHTIKGSSRMLKFNNVQNVAHELEEVFKGVKDKRYDISRKLVSLVLCTVDYLRHAARKIKETGKDDFHSELLLKTFQKAYANAPFSIEELSSEMKELTEAEGAVTEAEGEKKKGLKVTNLSQYDSIRIKISRIDEIVKLVNSLIIRQFQLKKDYERIEKLEEILVRSIERVSHQQANANNQGAAVTDGRVLKEVKRLKKDLSERITFLESNAFELQASIFDLRMLPLELIIAPMGRMVEELAMSLGKEVKLQVTGTEVRLDKLILESINDPLIHLVRNAVDHGIEPPQERERKGKEKTGRVYISCTGEKGRLLIKVGDDGKGIDYNRVRKKAQEIDPLKKDEIASMSNGELLSYLFMPGFSTSGETTEVSGRGVGLDIVKYNIERVKGKISVESEKEQGCVFSIILPLSLATVEGFFVVSSGKKYFFPSSHVREILVYNKRKVLELPNMRGIKIGNKIVPVYELEMLLNRDLTEEAKRKFIVVIQSLEEIMGIIVDSVLEYSSLIYKSAPRNLRKLNLIQGIVFDENFNMVNMLYIPGLMERFKNLRNIDLKQRFKKDSKKCKRILIVDDSVYTRDIERSILEGAGYTVETALDGIEALEKMKSLPFNLVITDIYMPRMDGFTLIENIKKDERHGHLPIMVLSALQNSELTEKAFSLGVEIFLGKEEFDRNMFVDEVNRLLSETFASR